MCRITISRFYRDPSVFDALRDEVLPAVGEAARSRGASSLQTWSVGAAPDESLPPGEWPLQPIGEALHRHQSEDA